jgi:TPR repeat protein
MLDKNDFFWKAFDLLNNGRYVQARELFEHLETDDAKIQLAYMYRLGLGGEPRLEASIQLYRDLVEKGNIIVAYDLASLLLSLNRSEEALFFFTLASEQGNSSATYWAAQICDGYKGANPDSSLYMHYLNKAAKQGHLFAQRDILKKKYLQSGSFIERLKCKFLMILIKWKSSKIIFKNPNHENVS